MTKPDPWDRITVVLVTRNSEAILPSSLGSLTGARRIILIDAMSTDDTLKVARACHPAVEVLSLTEDRGLGAATNKGFALVDTEYVLNINPDTRMPEGCVEQLARTADANLNAAGIAPVLTNANGDVDLSVMGPGERHHQAIAMPPDGPFCTWFLTGAVVLWRVSAFRDIGGFDEDIFLYNEDTDLSVRAMQKGYPLIVDPAAQGDHFGGYSEELSLKSRIRRDRNMMWGHLNYERKYAGAEEADRAARQAVRKCCGEALKGAISLRPKKLLTNVAKAKAAYSFLKGHTPWGRS
ncbi:MAG: glycosyltransferase family 2 protein [Rhodospirillales bacterium]|nr:glycosyltransferase family 2 protein [Rhodospirillales bacterium]